MGLYKDFNHNDNSLHNEKDKSKKQSDFRVLTALALVTQLGLIIGASTAGGVFLGGWVDMKLSTKGILVIIGAVLGLTAGLLAGYRLIRRALG